MPQKMMPGVCSVGSPVFLKRSALGHGWCQRGSSSPAAYARSATPSGLIDGHRIVIAHQECGIQCSHADDGAESRVHREPGRDTIFTPVTQLPVADGAARAWRAVVNGTSGGTNGLASLSTVRSGHYPYADPAGQPKLHAPPTCTGVPDISEFPQLLTQRVDVVTAAPAPPGVLTPSPASSTSSPTRNSWASRPICPFGLSTYGDNATITLQSRSVPASRAAGDTCEGAAEFSHMDGVEGRRRQQLTAVAGGRTTPCPGDVLVHRTHHFWRMPSPPPHQPVSRNFLSLPTASRTSWAVMA